MLLLELIKTTTIKVNSIGSKQNYKWRFYLLIILLIPFLFSSCSDGAKKGFTEFDSNDSCINKIIIENKTGNNFQKKECIIYDNEVIQEFKNECNNLTEVNNVKTKCNNGFYSINFMNNDNVIVIFRVLYTVYDGVIISRNDKSKSYKNDKIEYLTIKYMQQ